MSKLYFYYAAMNAGKSTALLQASYNYQEQGMQTLLFSPEIDVRFDSGKIVSRIGLKKKAIVFSGQFDFLDYIQTFLNKQAGKPNRLACVLLDEAQFLTKAQVLQLTDLPDRLNVPVLAYGLRTDFQGELFEGSQYLLGLADELIELKTICYCGAKAIMNLRLDAQGHPIREGEQVAIGGNELYRATCRKHFKAGSRLESIQQVAPAVVSEESCL